MGELKNWFKIKINLLINQYIQILCFSLLKNIYNYERYALYCPFQNHCLFTLNMFLLPNFGPKCFKNAQNCCNIMEIHSNWFVEILFIWTVYAMSYQGKREKIWKWNNYTYQLTLGHYGYYGFSCYLFGKIWQCTHFAQTNTFCLQCPRAAHTLRSEQFFLFPSLELICRLVWSCDPDTPRPELSVNLRLWVESFRDLFRRFSSAQLWKEGCVII